MTAPGLRALATLSLLTLAACGLRTERGNFPVSYVERNSFTVVLHPAHNARTSDLIDLRVFDGFTPGLTGPEAIQSVGEPDFYEDGENTLVYVRDAGRVEVTYRTFGSGEETYSKWFLIARPSRNGIARPEVLEYLGRLTQEVFITDHRGDSVVQLETDGKKIETVVWLQAEAEQD